MPLRAASSSSPFALARADRYALAARLDEAVRKARAVGHPVLAAHVVPAPEGTDPSGVVWAARSGTEPWFCFEQPDRGGLALAALGCVARIEARGADRFTQAATRWRRLAREAVIDGGRPGPPGAGLVALGGFAFADEGGTDPAWDGFAPASLHVPELSLARKDGHTVMTLAAHIAPDDDADQVCTRLAARAETLRHAELPLLDPDPADRARLASTLPPEHYEEAVARGVERIRAGALEKIVLAREVRVEAGRDHDAAAVLGVLRGAFPACYVFAVGRGDAAFIAASPELLVRREGQRASTVALAGSIRRSADPAVDDHLGEQLLRSAKDRGEQAIVARRIERILRPHAVWVTAAPEPALARVANIQHLATPIRAQLARRMGTLDLAALLHPTPAVGAEPRAAGLPLIPALEGMDRGWYAGCVGWTDAHDDGELCVALRCALVRGRTARCYAGVGVVADSVPSDELAETEVKLEALLPVLAV